MNDNKFKDIDTLTKLTIIKIMTERIIKSIIDNSPYDSKNKEVALQVFEKFADSLLTLIKHMDDTIFKDICELTGGDE